MYEYQLYSVLLELKLPWKVEKVPLDPEKKTVDGYITHENCSKPLCSVCRRRYMVHDHTRERICGDQDSIEFPTFIYVSYVVPLLSDSAYSCELVPGYFPNSNK